MQALRLIAFDSYQLLSPAEYDPKTPVRVVDIDEESLGKIGQWPWSRTIIADLVTKLTEQGAAVVAFDIVLFGAGPHVAGAGAEADGAGRRGGLQPLIAGKPTHDRDLCQGRRGNARRFSRPALSQARVPPPPQKAGFCGRRRRSAACS